ncbi:MAG TPA: LysM peptidoglycan-binding domain-containing protein [Acidimicrobiales bacterium]
MATWLTRYRVWVLCSAGGLLGSLVPVAMLAGAPAAAVSVQVGPGQTLSQIAVNNGTTVSALAAANGIADPNLVLAGATLLIPAGSGGTAAAASTQTTTIVVAAGDNLTGIAARYGTTVAELVALNGITDPNNIEAGSRLLVGGPVPAPAGGTVTEAAASTGAGLPAQVLAHPDRVQLQPVFQQWAGTFGVPVSLLEAMCWWESGWQSGVVSSTGAVGIGQLEPYTVSSLRISLGDPTLDPTIPSNNIEMSAALLHDLLVQSGGSESVALASYYQGFTSVSQSGMFASTTQYVQGILSSVAGFS